MTQLILTHTLSHHFLIILSHISNHHQLLIPMAVLHHTIKSKPAIHPVDLIIVRSNLADIQNDHGDRTSGRQIGGNQFGTRVI
jgi:hypothetical protein